MNNKRANFFSNLKYNKENKACETFNNSNNKNNNSNNNIVIVNSNNSNKDFINLENKSQVILMNGKAFSDKFAFEMKSKRKANKAFVAAGYSLRDKSNVNGEFKIMLYARKFSHDDFLVKNKCNNNFKQSYLDCKKDETFPLERYSDNYKMTNKNNINKNKNINCIKKFDDLQSYFYCFKIQTKKYANNNKKNCCKSFDLGKRIFIEDKDSNGTKATRKTSNILYNLISSNYENLNEKQAQEKNNLNSDTNINFIKSKFDSLEKLDNLANMINSEKKSNSANVIGPAPNIKEIKKNFAFNKSYDSLDIQSEFLISYLRDEELVSEVSQSIRNTESNRAKEENDNYEKDSKQEENGNNNKNNINDHNQRNNFVKNKNFQEKVFLNINNKYVKNLNSNNNNNKNINFNTIENLQNNKQLETVENSNHENNKINNNKNCCFFTCKSNPNHNTNNNNIFLNNNNNINSKVKKGKKQDANINSYYSTINNTKRSTNHSFKSIRLNDSLTKFRKRRLSNCTTDRDSKCPTRGSNSNLANLMNANDKKDKKVDCRCEIF